MNLPTSYKNATFKERREIREEYIRRQNGRCWHCHRPLIVDPSDSVLKKDIDWSLFPPTFLKWPIHLHHDHKTDMTIGAVHAYCNAVLWQYHGK